MQKIINVLAVLSFVGVSGIVGGGAYVYFQRDALIESAKEKITAAATEALTGALPGMLDSAVPKACLRRQVCLFLLNYQENETSTLVCR